MPFKSKAQQKWAHSPAGLKKLGAEKVKEYDDKTNFKNLKERIFKKKK